MKRCLALIGGEHVDLSNSFEDIDPSTGEVLSEIVRCGSAEINQAVEAARETFERSWRQVEPAQRARMMRRMSDLIYQKKDALAELESRDTGKPLRQAHADANLAARYFEFYANAIEALHGDTFNSHNDLVAFTVREPYGVTAHIIPWNYPMQIGARTIAPALAVGNCCVLKPAEEAPLTAYLIGQLALEAGFPPGTLNVVPGLGEEAGAALAAHSGIDHLAFTGSVEVGRLVAKAAAENTVPVTLELGGKSPNIILEDADLDQALPVVVNSVIQNAGQTCSAGSRLLVQEQVHDSVINLVADRFRAIRIGRAIDDPDLGPLISGSQLERVKKYVEIGRNESELVIGGHAPADKGLKGYFFTPTLFDRVPAGATIANEEIFGPVLATMAFENVEEAAATANATDYGLVAAIWTKDVNKAHWLAKEIRAGQVFVNTYGAGGGVELPFGGYKRSGYGREKGFEALLSYTRTKTIAIRVVV